jgi:CheY-like chemotaxis protein
VFRPVPQDVHGLLDNLAGMLRRLLGEQYEIVLKPDAAAPVVAVDAGMLDQVIVNLCLNARDAMPDGGAIAIATGEVDADAEFCRLRGWNTPGRFVTISVTDAGTGMSDGVRRRIFEPFFTTKDVGKGTGLGLSIVYGIVEQHGGRIEVESAPGRGSAFHIYLPVAEERPPAEADTARAEVPGGTETLLVAEDDPMLLDLTLQLLAEKGYRVLTARDGLEAVQLFASHITEIDLVLMDVIMPRMSGRAAYDQIRAIAPDLPVIFVTGYSGEALDAPLTKRPDFHLIRKPYAADALFTKIRQVLDRYGKAPKPDADKGQTQLPGSG